MLDILLFFAVVIIPFIVGLRELSIRMERAERRQQEEKWRRMQSVFTEEGLK